MLSKAIFAAAYSAVATAFNAVPATSSNVYWVGRTIPNSANGSVAFDWEGVSATMTLNAPYTFLAANISDNCPGSSVGGGSRWLVTLTTSDGNAMAPAHRVATFWTGPLQNLYYLFSIPGAKCDPNCNLQGSITVTLTRLTESRLSGCVPGQSLFVNSFVTDGAFAAPPAPSTRRIEFIGDSISAGDLNDGGGPPAGPGPGVCGNAVFNDDITLSTGGQLCLPTALGGFGADCMYTAWGGIRLGTAAQGWGMTQLYPFTFSADGPNAYQPWDHSRFPVDAVVINLGTNDRPTPPALDWQAGYVNFVQNLVHTYYNNSALQLFLAYGPMTNEYQPLVTNVTATLVSQGINAHLLDLTLPHGMTGCYGHPSAADNIEIAAKAKPQIGAVMGWQ